MIYLDHAATTPVRSEVLDAMMPFFSLNYGNPSSLHHKGQEASQALEDARQSIAKDLNCYPDEIVFTSGGTESDNLAIRGYAFANQRNGKHIITSCVEHHAVLNTCRQLQQHHGFEVTYLPVDSTGMVSPDDFQGAIKPETILASIMYANNEVGTIEPIRELARIAHDHDVGFHTDAVQVLGLIDLNLRELGVDMLSLSAHKCYGPKGVGVLFVKRGVLLMEIHAGGGQESTRRSGTENVPGIVGMATAIHLAFSGYRKNLHRLEKLRDRLIEYILEEVPGAQLTGHPAQRLPNSASFTFPNIPGPDELILLLDLNGIAASSGSACHAKSIEPSHVLTAMGVSLERSSGSLRLSLGYENTEEEIKQVLHILPEVVMELQGLSGGFHATNSKAKNPYLESGK
jgi:cysteine desulfurase